MQLGEKKLFCECDVWCPSKARVTTTRVKLMFFSCRTRFCFLLRDQKMDVYPPLGAIKFTLWSASRKKYVMKRFHLLSCNFAVALIRPRPGNPRSGMKHTLLPWPNLSALFPIGTRSGAAFHQRWRPWSGDFCSS